MLGKRIIYNLKKFFRNKLHYIIIILISLCFAFSLIINSVSYSARKYFNDNILNWVDYRIFDIVIDENDTEEDIENLKNTLKSIPEIEAVFDKYGYMSYWYVNDLKDYDIKEDGAGFWLNGISGKIPAIYGENLDNNSDEASIICPMNYKPLEIPGYEDVTIDLKPYVGKYLSIRYIDKNNPVEFKVKLVGLYDNDLLKRNYRECYINYQNLTNMNKSVISSKSRNMYYQLKNIVDEQKVTKELQEKGYWPDPIMFGERTIALETMDTLNYISYGLIAMSALIILFIITFNISKSKNNIILNKIFGYSNKNLALNYFIESITLFIMSLLFSSIFLIILFNVLKKLIPIYYKSFAGIPLQIDPSLLFKSILLLSILCLVVGVISFIFASKRNIYKSVVEDKE